MICKQDFAQDCSVIMCSTLKFIYSLMLKILKLKNMFMKYGENDSVKIKTSHKFYLHKKKSTFLNSSVETVSQPPSGNDNVYTESFYVFAALLVLMFMKNASNVSLERSSLTN